MSLSHLTDEELLRHCIAQDDLSEEARELLLRLEMRINAEDDPPLPEVPKVPHGAHPGR